MGNPLEGVAKWLEKRQPMSRGGAVLASTAIAGAVTGALAERAEAAEVNFPADGPITDSGARTLISRLVGCDRYGGNDRRVSGMNGNTLSFNLNGITGTITWANGPLEIVYNGITHSYTFGGDHGTDFSEGFWWNLTSNNQKKKRK